MLPMRALMQRMCPREFVESATFSFSINEKLDINARRIALDTAGYRHVTTVYERGEYAIRGAIVDVFPVGVGKPLRIELFDDEIETLRFFDTETQLTTERVDKVDFLPTKEFPLDENGIANFRNSWHREFSGNVRECRDYQDVSDGIAPDGIECYLPLFFSKMETLFDYLPSDSVFVLDDQIDQSAELLTAEVESRYENLRYDFRRPLLSPNKLYLSHDEVRMRWNEFPRIQWASETTSPHSVDMHSVQLPEITTNHRLQDPVEAFRRFLDGTPSPVLLVAETLGRREFISELMQHHGIELTVVESFEDFQVSRPSCAITVATMDRPCANSNFVVVTEMELFQSHSVAITAKRRKNVVDPDLILRNLTEIQVGDPVVHLEHGVGRYGGLEILKTAGYPVECMIIEYADSGRIYVPAASLDIVSRYVGGDDENLPLHNLGGKVWRRAKRKALEKINDVAAELLQMYALRQVQDAHQYPAPNSDYLTFCEQCPFQLTDDQASTTDSVIDDLRSNRPMDRLVCGDVGFGKTEVAMRAAFHVVQSGMQVVVLVPTTLLASQHYETFSDRFAAWPIKVDYLSRLRTPKERQEVLGKLKSGSLDIVIGTHQLLGRQIQVNSLGLLVIDEEHRFGVQQKEKIKELSLTVDLLTLTATPIPRTLNMALENVRQMSVIATPPAKRLSIKTFCVEHNESVIADAINRELDRGGQVYYVHNRVDTIRETAERLQGLNPRARIGVAHGEMPKRELESVMSDFYHRERNLLVCTTIIESGIDVPNANTIILDRADRLGLAQLHQLRGRVGRAQKQAYAYLLTPPPDVMTSSAEKRLDAIQAADELGAGFTLAMHDLEIRGAGELLGSEQSGVIEGIGYSLYLEMLNETIVALEKGEVPNLEKKLNSATGVDFHVPALIPSTYVPDVGLRLILYKRLANASSNLELDRLQVEFIDRFGRLPSEVNNLFRISRIKLKAEQLGLGSVKFSLSGGQIELIDYEKFNSAKLIQLVQRQGDTYSFRGENFLTVQTQTESTDESFTFIETFLRELEVPETDKAA